ncbi:hypothetical protein GALMADRAFT_258262 [Galerina marginata CBS 339.88]|uniref:Asl1-like glycosyl hydrolase catalytic domain-containing protein n=1 Tax=Galerina marginata (strain CBS 339.88) TaxID=685588 RepID=A0A067S9K2_GALM3|nr:hypothetical protein GALMADRAFT_258262 [Galerina marginata CBS 339.88]
MPSSHLQTRSVTNTSKAGLAWPNADSVDISQFGSTGKISWYYTWSPFPTDSNFEFVPMFWGTKSIDQFSSTIQQTLSNKRMNVTAILGMNEPEQAGQSNLTAQEGVQLWQTYVQPLHGMGLRLGSPAPSSAPSGKVWLQDFFTACGTNCTVDFIAMHWYGTNATQFISYLQDYHDTFQKPLWVTEWSCQNYVNLQDQCSADEIVQFLNTTQSFMDSADFVERYSWFGAMPNTQGVNPADALLDNKGRINALGQQYIGVQGNQTNSSNPNIIISRGLSLFPFYSLVTVVFGVIQVAFFML